MDGKLYIVDEPQGALLEEIKSPSTWSDAQTMSGAGKGPARHIISDIENREGDLSIGEIFKKEFSDVTIDTEGSEKYPTYRGTYEGYIYEHNTNTEGWAMQKVSGMAPAYKKTIFEPQLIPVDPAAIMEAYKVTWGEAKHNFEAIMKAAEELGVEAPVEAPVKEISKPKGISKESSALFDEIAASIGEDSAEVSQPTGEVTGEVEKAVKKLDDDLCT